MRKGRNMRAAEGAALAALLLLFAAQVLLSSPQKSAAFDEQYHLAAGYAYLKTGDVRMSLSHPPLINALSAAPLLARADIHLPLEHAAWAAADYFTFADVFMWQSGNDAQGMLLAARAVIALLGVLLALAIFLWARQWAGPTAAWAALMLAVLDPNLLANSRLVTTDLGLALFYFVAVWLLWRWLQGPSAAKAVLAGGAAGLACAAKFTGLLIWPTFAALLLLYPRAAGSGRQRLAAAVLMAAAGGVALWAVYGFDVGAIPGSGLALPVPAPFYPYSVWDTFMVIEEQPKTAYLLGQTSPRGWWYYFPVALAVKTPLPMLLLAVGGAVKGVKGEGVRSLDDAQDEASGHRPHASPEAAGWRWSAPLWLPPLLFLGLAMSGRITIGYRHILPVVPFLIVLAGLAVAALWQAGAGRRWLRVLAVGLLLWQAAGVLRLWPHQEAYFNELGGGPEGGSRVLVDSNLDWGQDLIALRRLLQERAIEQPYLAYFGTALPEAYGLAYRPLPAFLRFTAGPEVEAYNPYTPAPGWYAISRSSLRLGLLHQNVDLYAYFEDKTPVARAGHSIDLYEVTYGGDTGIARTVVTGRSVADMAPEALGVGDGERLIVKWAASPQSEIVLAEQAAAETPPQVSVEANFGEVMTLAGYELRPVQIAAGEPLTLTLTWRVGRAPMPQPAPATAPPLAAFVHLSDEQPANILAQFDGWGTALTGLEPGDLVRQWVTLALPPEDVETPYYLQIGLYSPQNGERLALPDGETFVRLGPIMPAAADGS